MGVSVEADPSRANFSVVRFAQDQRLAEVEVILDSSRVPNVKIPDRPDLKYVYAYFPARLARS